MEMTQIFLRYRKYFNVMLPVPVPLGELALVLEAGHLPGLGRDHLDILPHLRRRRAPLLAVPYWGVNTSHVEP